MERYSTEGWKIDGSTEMGRDGTELVGMLQQHAQVPAKGEKPGRSISPHTATHACYVLRSKTMVWMNNLFACVAMVTIH